MSEKANISADEDEVVIGPLIFEWDAANGGIQVAKGVSEATETIAALRARVEELEREKEEAERLRLIEHRKMFDECERAEAEVLRLREALERCADASSAYGVAEQGGAREIARRVLHPTRLDPDLSPALEEEEEAMKFRKLRREVAIAFITFAVVAVVVYVVLR